MSFLKLNGLTIPISSGGALTPEEIGDRSRSFSGMPLIDRRAIKRKWRFQTTSLDPVTAAIVDGLLLAKGDSFLWDQPDIYSTKGVGPSSGGLSVGWMPDRGKIGNHLVYDHNGKRDSLTTGCIGLHRAQTNLIDVANVRTGGDTNGDTTGFTAIAGATISRVTDLAWRGTGSIKVDPSTGPNGLIEFELGQAGGTGSNNLVAFYVYVDTTSTIRVRFRGNVSGTGSFYDIPCTAGQWTRISLFGIPGGGDTSYFCQVTEQSDNDFWIDGVCGTPSWSSTTYRQTPPWVDSDTYPTHDAELPITLINQFKELTFSVWILHDWIDTNKPEANLFRAEQDPSFNNGSFVLARAPNSDAIVAYGLLSDGTSYGVSKAGLMSDRDWHHVAVVLRSYPKAGEDPVEIWTDGVLADSDAGSVGPLFSNLLRIKFGFDIGDEYWFGKADSMLLLPYAADASLIAALAGQAGFSGLPKLLASGDFLGQGNSVEVVPFVPQEGYRGRQFESSWQNAMRSIAFELHEV